MHADVAAVLVIRYGLDYGDEDLRIDLRPLEKGNA